MITHCPHCQNKVRTRAPGKYRCPICREVFEAGEPATIEPAKAEPYTDESAIESPFPETESSHEDADLYIDQSEMETACETCGRPGAETVCTGCGKFVCETCVGKLDHAGLCPVCQLQPPGDKPIAVPEGLDPQIAASGFMPTFVPRLKAVLISPSRFFSTTLPSEAPYHPYLFAVLCYCLGGVFAVAYSLVLQRSMLDFLETFNQGLTSWLNMESLMDAPGELFLETTLFLPAQAILGLFFISGIVHLFLLILGRPQGRFAGTLRIVAYSNATHLLQVVPILGGIVAFVWQLAIVIIGAGRVHKMSSNRTALAVLLPFGLLLILGLVVGLALLAAFNEATG